MRTAVPARVRTLPGLVPALLSVLMHETKIHDLSAVGTLRRCMGDHVCESGVDPRGVPLCSMLKLPSFRPGSDRSRTQVTGFTTQWSLGWCHSWCDCWKCLVP